LAGLWCFRNEKCESCHNLGSGEPKLGPTLATVAEKKSADWMIAHFKNPQQVVPGTPMPALQLPANLLNALASFLLKLTPANSSALEMTPDFAAAGARIYEEHNCSLCHQINGAGNTVGPPLNGLAGRRGRDWVVGHFREPTKFSPGSAMPAYGFEPKEMDALVDYLFALPPK
jgi:cbb3-type cytochrome oxidase cytochrome c subunit